MNFRDGQMNTRTRQMGRRGKERVEEERTQEDRRGKEERKGEERRQEERTPHLLQPLLVLQWKALRSMP